MTRLSKDTRMKQLRVDALEAAVLQLKKGFQEAGQHPNNELISSAFQEIINENYVEISAPQ